MFECGRIFLLAVANVFLAGRVQSLLVLGVPGKLMGQPERESLSHVFTERGWRVPLRCRVQISAFVVLLYTLTFIS